MKSYNILTSGEKIKDIRNRFNLTQEEIVGTELTRNLISIVEINKATLTETSAKVLVTNINNICKEKNIDFVVTEDYLLEDVVSQCKKIADEYISYIISLPKDEISKISDTLTEIDIFLKTYNTEEKKALLYIEIGDKFKAIREYSKAFEYYVKSYENSSDLAITTDSLVSLSLCSIYLSRYEDAINYCKILLSLNKEELTQFRAKYNMALCYKRLNKFEDALATLDDISSSCANVLSSYKKSYLDVQLLTGSCLSELKSFNKAINLYKNLLKVVENEKDELCVLSSLADVYRDINDSVKLEKICNTILKKINSSPSALNEYGSYIYLTLANNIKSINPNSETVTFLLLKALEDFKVGNSSLYLEDIETLFGNLLDIFIQTENESKIDFLKNELFELIEKRVFPKASITALKIINYYNFKDKKQDISNLINYLIS